MNKKQKLITYISCGILTLILLVSFILMVIYNHNDLYWKIYATLVIFTISAAILYVFYIILNGFINRKELVKKSFNSFSQAVISNNNIGIIIYDNYENIIWTSQFIKDKFNNNCIGWNIAKFFRDYSTNLSNINRNTSFQIKHKNCFYEVQIWPIKNTISIRDITVEILVKEEAREQQIVIGELEIDNFQLYQSMLSEEQLFNINKSVVNAIEKVIKQDDNNLIYRQYTNGKIIIITNRKTIDILQEREFRDLVNIESEIALSLGNKVTLSIGFATGWSKLETMIEQAKKALLQAQNRGGDQVAIFSNSTNPIYYGSTSQIMPDNNRSTIKLIGNNLVDKFKSKDIDNVIVYGHSTADLDAIGAAWAIHDLAKRFGKNSYIGIRTFDLTSKRVMSHPLINIKITDLPFIDLDKISKLTTPRTVVVFVDISDVKRTDNKDAIINAKSENIFIFDHHRVGSNVDYCPRENRYIDPNASSACEIVTELITFIEQYGEIDKKTAQLLLNGIYLDTSQFTKSVTSRAFMAASWLQSKGASGSISNELLKNDVETNSKVESLLENLSQVKEGFFLAYKDEVAENDVISMAANEILNISGRKASFVVAKLPNSNTYKLSARGIDTNVQIICEAVGGGGHFGTAAAVSDEKLDVFIDNIKQAIVGNRG
ncbi:DHH family phosphoesterase [Mycoplasma crocodyli]|uniref:DHHA1 domain protein n=1 Tax=Mycoplasma crocodyli (strain ATCC 51981 / MP145) TaxID=512564 RepID=D5E5M4_MYCCM|nr:DHH family phosphoesterase [Mycoplasma crocodyli]ADE19604.1 DHHA1 domain protein [Mycoplasma crocodyli MP145]